MNQGPRNEIDEPVPLLRHALDSPSAFQPEGLIAAVRSGRGLPALPVPPVCVLDFDGDLTDELAALGELRKCDHWPCFHSTLWLWETGGATCGILARSIGGPYAVLIAEQLAVCGARVILGLTSAGGVRPDILIPSVVVAEKGIRDEGTSYHYLPPGEECRAYQKVVDALWVEMHAVGLPAYRGTVWTTDAPYRETAEDLRWHAEAGALAGEMQAASLFAFGAARRFPVGVVAHVTNATNQKNGAFEKGAPGTERRLLEAIARAGQRLVSASK